MVGTFELDSKRTRFKEYLIPKMLITFIGIVLQQRRSLLIGDVLGYNVIKARNSQYRISRRSSNVTRLRRGCHHVESTSPMRKRIDTSRNNVVYFRS